MGKLLTLGLVFGTMAAGLGAQDTLPTVKPFHQNKPGTSGIVTGVVYCADTNQPARMAHVSLVPFSGDPTQGKMADTDLEGRFSIPRVPEGNYFVSANLAGYRNPLAAMPRGLGTLTPEARKDLESRAPHVTVSAKTPGEISLRLERAAEIDGTVSFDDGSPAIGLRVGLKAKADKSPLPGDGQVFNSFEAYGNPQEQLTDDHGHFRILGIEPGEYLVSVMVPQMVPPGSAEHADSDLYTQLLRSSPLGGLVVYGGDTLRASKAKAIKVAAGDVTRDADITISLNRLHTIRGQVTLKSSGQPPVAANVQLLYADTREFARVAVAPDGEFEIPYVPEGSFILVATAMSEALPKLNFDEDESIAMAGGHQIVFGDLGHSAEGSAEIQLLVSSDTAGVVIAVPDPVANKANAAPGLSEQVPVPSSTPQ
jgi:hypothetical protein